MKRAAKSNHRGLKGDFVIASLKRRDDNFGMEQTTKRRFRFLPLTVRLETVGGVATPLALRGTPLPTTRSDIFSTATENQKAVELKLLIGESPLSRKNLSLGAFHLKDIPPARRGVAQINVVFSIDDTCTVTACASLQGSNVSSEQKFEAPENLSDESIAKMIASAEKDRSTDEETLRRIESENRANNLIARAEARLKERATDVDAVRAEAALRRAIVRLSVVEKINTRRKV